MAMALALLRLQDTDQFLFQRRDFKTSVYPGLLTLFGGKIEHEESTRQAFLREMVEETSYSHSELSRADHVLHKCPISLSDGRTVTVDVFYVEVSRPPAYVYEGAGAESFTLEEVLSREDLAEVTRLTITEVIDNGDGAPV